MLDGLQNEKKVIGIKQSTRAVEDGLARCAFIAADSADTVRLPFLSLCKSKGIEVIEVESMEQLGKACDIDVGSAVAVILKS